MRIATGAFLSAMLWVLAISYSAHAADDVFTVQRVEVDATGASASAARGVALARGRAAAFRQLVQRLTPEEYWADLPQPESSDLVQLVSGFLVANEKTSATRYLAEVTYSFDADGIRTLLRTNNIPFSESRYREAIVLPIFETADGIALWEEDNAWRLAWREQMLTNELVPLSSPLGELEDIVSVRVEDALSADWTRLGPFAARYGVGDVLIAYALLEGEGADQRLAIRLTRVSAPNVELGEQSTLSLAFRNSQSVSLDDLLAFAIRRTIGRLQSDWKSQTIIESDAVETPLIATAQFETHDEWLEIRQRLDSMPTIRRFRTVAISLGGAELDMSYVGSFAQLRTLMAQRDLNLIDGGSRAVVALRQTIDSMEMEDGMGTIQSAPLSDGLSDPAINNGAMIGDDARVFGAEPDGLGTANDGITSGDLPPEPITGPITGQPPEQSPDQFPTQDPGQP